MIKITKNNDVIVAQGHAENEIVCAMYTALTIALLKNLTERLHVKVRYDLEDGYFMMDTKFFVGTPKEFIDSYLYSIKELSKSYPKSFNIKY